MAILHERDWRGGGKMGWLDTAHTFSFGHFYDPNRMGFRALRVLNEDRVVPGAGFPEHAHASMDIITYVISGALMHKDSLGTGSIIKSGEIQRMSAGSGITHSEMNASPYKPVHFLQMWIVPEKAGGEPSYEQKTIDDEHVRNRFGLIAGSAPDRRSVVLHSDTRLYCCRADAEEIVLYELGEKRGGFLQIVKGQVVVAGNSMTAGDGLQFEGPATLSLTTTTDSEVLLFDLA